MDEIREVYGIDVYNEDTGETLKLEPLKDGDGIKITWDEQGIIRFEP